MFLPSEAVYAELHANFPEIVRDGFAARVWIVSPTTCMATLNTMRAILKDARMQEQAGAIRKELSLLYADVDRLGTRVENLDRHFGQAAKDIADIKISADKAGRRARRLDNFDFEELAADAPAGPAELAKSGGMSVGARRDPACKQASLRGLLRPGGGNGRTASHRQGGFTRLNQSVPCATCNDDMRACVCPCVTSRATSTPNRICSISSRLFRMISGTV